MPNSTNVATKSAFVSGGVANVGGAFEAQVPRHRLIARPLEARALRQPHAVLTRARERLEGGAAAAPALDGVDHHSALERIVEHRVVGPRAEHRRVELQRVVVRLPDAVLNREADRENLPERRTLENRVVDEPALINPARRSAPRRTARSAASPSRRPPGSPRATTAVR